MKKSLEKEMYSVLKNAKDVEEAKILLNNNLPTIKNNIATTLANNKFDYGYSANLGLNYFPSKNYKGIIYEEGEYESLVVTLGSGEGDNWWCVLFPPLCLLEAEENNIERTEYQFFIKKLIDKYMK